MSGDYRGLPDEDKFADVVTYNVSCFFSQVDPETGEELAGGAEHSLDFEIKCAHNRSPNRIMINLLNDAIKVREGTDDVTSVGDFCT